MSTTPTEVRTTIHGVALALYPGDASWPIQIQRAPDDNGSPDEANATVIAILGAGERTYVDIRSGGTWHYRARHKRAGAVPGVWTVWVGATPKQIPADLPQLPGPDGRYDLSRVRETARTATSITIDWDVGSKVHHVHVFQKASASPLADPWPTADDHKASYGRVTTSHEFDLPDLPFSYAFLQPEAENGKRGNIWKKVLQSAQFDDLHVDGTVRSVTSTDTVIIGGDVFNGEILEQINVPPGKIGPTGALKLGMFIKVSGTAAAKNLTIGLNDGNDITDTLAVFNALQNDEDEQWLQVLLRQVEPSVWRATRIGNLGSTTAGNTLLTGHQDQSTGLEVYIVGDTNGSSDVIELQLSELLLMGAS